MDETRWVTFDELVEGRQFPPFHYWLTGALARRYAEVTAAEPADSPDAPIAPPGEGDPVPPLLLDTLHALKAVLAFPEGVIHAREEVEFHLPGRVGDRVTIRLAVLERYVRNARKFVVFEQRAENDHGATLAVARKTLIWPE